VETGPEHGPGTTLPTTSVGPPIRVFTQIVRPHVARPVGLAQRQLSPPAVTNLPTRPSARRSWAGPTVRPGVPLRRRGGDADEPSQGTPGIGIASDDNPRGYRHARWCSTTPMLAAQTISQMSAGFALTPGRSSARWPGPDPGRRGDRGTGGHPARRAGTRDTGAVSTTRVTFREPRKARCRRHTSAAQHQTARCRDDRSANRPDRLRPEQPKPDRKPLGVVGVASGDDQITTVTSNSASAQRSRPIHNAPSLATATVCDRVSKSWGWPTESATGRLCLPEGPVQVLGHICTHRAGGIARPVRTNTVRSP